MIEVLEMQSGKWIVTDGDVPLSGIAGTSKEEAMAIAARLKKQKKLEQLKVSELEKMIKARGVDSDLAYHALMAKRAKRKRAAGRKWNY